MIQEQISDFCYAKACYSSLIIVQICMQMLSIFVYVNYLAMNGRAYVRAPIYLVAQEKCSRTYLYQGQLLDWAQESKHFYLSYFGRNQRPPGQVVTFLNIFM